LSYRHPFQPACSINQLPVLPDLYLLDIRCLWKVFLNGFEIRNTNYRDFKKLSALPISLRSGNFDWRIAITAELTSAMPGEWMPPFAILLQLRRIEC
jgi:hypothetical protein